ncbi:MAG: DUF4350 domain-containing protein [Novosphingobium sp.]
MSARQTGPFSPRVALGLVLFGMISFVALLWMIGAGMDDSAPKASGGHAMGKGLNGYAALSQYLERRGFKVSRVQSRAGLNQPSTLILTPLHFSDPKELSAVVEDHREFGPTIILLPKWLASPPRKGTKGAKDGFVRLIEAVPPEWKGFYDDIALERGALMTSQPPGAWEGAGLSGTVPAPQKVFSGRGESLVPLVFGQGTGRILAGYMADYGDYPALRDMAGKFSEDFDPDDSTGQYPVIMVFDADLFNNWGMNRPENAMLAERLIRAASDGKPMAVAFDLTLDGYGRSQSLLTLAFRPPFLAATLCLLLAAAVALWRAFQRFGPPVLAGRSIAFGKRALVANAAGLIHRARRLRLLGAPYADAARERLVRGLALPSRLDHAAAEAAIDRALAARSPGSPPFSLVAAQLRAATRPTDMLRAARQLHALERTLTR